MIETNGLVGLFILLKKKKRVIKVLLPWQRPQGTQARKASTQSKVDCLCYQCPDGRKRGQGKESTGMGHQWGREGDREDQWDGGPKSPMRGDILIILFLLSA